MLERSQYAPSSPRSCGEDEEGGGFSRAGDVGPEEASLIFLIIVCTSAPVGGAAAASCSAGGLDECPCPLDRFSSVVPFILEGLKLTRPGFQT